MAELYLLTPLFPGTSETDQIMKTCDVLGSPTQKEWPDGHRLAQKMNFKFPVRGGIPLSKKLAGASPQAIDLIGKMISYDPAKRMTASAALKHPFFAGFKSNPAAALSVGLSKAMPGTSADSSMPASRALKILSRTGKKSPLGREKAKLKVLQKKQPIAHGPLST